jgi:hypothetical protein
VPEGIGVHGDGVGGSWWGSCRSHSHECGVVR